MGQAHQARHGVHVSDVEVVGVVPHGVAGMGSIERFAAQREPRQVCEEDVVNVVAAPNAVACFEVAIGSVQLDERDAHGAFIAR
jgi:hypothetical protein